MGQIFPPKPPDREKNREAGSFGKVTPASPTNAPTILHSTLPPLLRRPKTPFALLAILTT